MNITKFFNDSLTALNDTTGAKTVNEWRTKLVAALTTLADAAGIATTATAAEINKAADVSSYVQELTATGAVSATTRILELNHISTIIAATYTVVPNTTLIIKDTSASGTAAHTVTLTSGTFNGTNTIATLNARDEFLMVHFDSAGRGQVIANVGSVALS